MADNQVKVLMIDDDEVIAQSTAEDAYGKFRRQHSASFGRIHHVRR